VNSLAFAFFLVAAIASLVTRWLARSPSTSGRLRENYINSRLPLAVRNGVALAPAYALAELSLAGSLAARPYCRDLRRHELQSSSTVPPNMDEAGNRRGNAGSCTAKPLGPTLVLDLRDALHFR
jgi:hypothetical protein